ncbi:MAG: FHA domain-containing protein [Myxococcales bacterium]|nr:FHA domain-containing protein [Myxococcales bacterium]
MSAEIPCCGACAHGLAVQAAGGPRPSTGPLLHARLVGGVPQGVEITVIAGRSVGRRIPLQAPETILGRTATADVQLDDEAISRRQCRFVLQDGHVLVEDLNSTCGTYVDDLQIREATPLRDGQRIHVGSTILRVAQARG